MKIGYKGKEFEILKHYNSEVDKYFVEVWLDHSNLAAFSRKDQEIICEFFFDTDTKSNLEIPLNVLEKATEYAKEFIEE